MFRPGQKVVCVEGNSDVYEGELYEVVSGPCEDGLLMIKGIGRCFASRFEPVAETLFGTFPFLNPGKGRV